MHMKKIFLFAIALTAMASMAFAGGDSATKELKVMSYNIRLGVGKDGTNSWQFRAPLTIEMIEDQAPDIFGVQEALIYQVEFIKEWRNQQE